VLPGPMSPSLRTVPLVEACAPLAACRSIRTASIMLAISVVGTLRLYKAAKNRVSSGVRTGSVAPLVRRCVNGTTSAAGAPMSLACGVDARGEGRMGFASGWGTADIIGGV
jgi:hypothetical protein